MDIGIDVSDSQAKDSKTRHCEEICKKSPISSTSLYAVAVKGGERGRGGWAPFLGGIHGNH